jgi:hypothetical protein
MLSRCSNIRFCGLCTLCSQLPDLLHTRYLAQWILTLTIPFVLGPAKTISHLFKAMRKVTTRNVSRVWLVA